MDTLELDLMDVIDCAWASIIHILAIPAEDDWCIIHANKKV